MEVIRVTRKPYNKERERLCVVERERYERVCVCCVCLSELDDEKERVRECAREGGRKTNSR